MKNLRNVLQFNKTLIIFTIFIFIYCFINSKINYKSKYNGNETSITGIITNIKIKSDYLELELKAKEKILAVDSSKFDQVAFAEIGSLDQITTIVTDAKPETRWLQHFDKIGVKCIYPK